VSAVEDHIAPWRATYAGAKLFSGPVKFVLGGSGHIAGIINPPAKEKYGFWTNAELKDDPQEWFESTEQSKGSWWVDWRQWVAKHAGEQVPARTPGDGELEVLEDAPGSFVKARLIK
jgi:polyhydroxyalkanoate synthase